MNTTCDQLTVDPPATSVTHAPQPLAGAREWAGLAVLTLPTILLGLDVTLMYLALPALAADLQPSSTQALWIMDVYGFMIAGFLITMGTLGDRIGRRRLLMIGAVAFGAASVLAAYSTSAVMLIAARAALGVAGATLMPSTLALISNMFANVRQQALAIGVWTTMFALGMAAGPVVGGVLLEHFWWGSAFLVAVPVVALLLVAAPVLLPEYRAPQRGQLDLFSVVLSLAATLPAIYGLKEGAKDGLGIEPIAALATGTVFAVWFVWRQRRLADPLLDMRLFTNWAFSAALFILFFGLVGVGGAMLLVTQYLQLVAGLSPLAAGLFMGPPALAMLIAGIVSPLLSRRIRPGFVVAGALTLSAVGYLLLTQLDSTSGIALLVTGFSLAYLGLGSIAALGTDLVISAAPASKAGSASAMSEMAQELGIAVGVAILGSLTTVLYRNRIADQIPGHLSSELSRAVGDSLWAAFEMANQLPGGLLAEARAAFTFGLNIANLASAAGAIILAILSAVALRHIGVIGGDAHDYSALDTD